MHHSGFVNIIGKPNVGKSTLMNALMGERMSIITNKPQTTRHRIIGIMSDKDYQIVFSDTPGIIQDPSYGMQKAMNRFAHSTFEDGDIMLFVTDVHEKYEDDDPIITRLKNTKSPVFLLLNKIDTVDEAQIIKLIQRWNKRIQFTETIPIAALHKKNTDVLLKLILDYLPEGPAYYPKDQFTDKSERFFASEIIREKILQNYHQEIPYSVEVIIESYKETQTNAGEPLIRIEATIFVARKSQKIILLGKNGSAIKRLSTAARKDIETFTEKKVFLQTFVKIKENWRDDEKFLKHFGYQ